MTEELPGIDGASPDERRPRRGEAPQPPPLLRSAAQASVPPELAPASAVVATPAPVPQVSQAAPPPKLEERSRHGAHRAAAIVPRPSAASSSPRPAATLLHAPSAVKAGSLGVSARPAFASNPALQLAQAVLAAQSLLAFVTAIDLIRGATSLAQLRTGVNLDPTMSLATHYAIGIIVIGALLLIGAVVVSHPSQTVRTLLVVLEVIALGLTLAAHFGGGAVFPLWTVMSMGATGSAVIPFGAVAGLQSAVIYLLALHPPTYRAFAR